MFRPTDLKKDWIELPTVKLRFGVSVKFDLRHIGRTKSNELSLQSTMDLNVLLSKRLQKIAQNGYRSYSVGNDDEESHFKRQNPW